jgi:hypothetical protein
MSAACVQNVVLEADHYDYNPIAVAEFADGRSVASVRRARIGQGGSRDNYVVKLQ